MSAIDQLVSYVTECLEESGGASKLPDDLRAELLPLVTLARREALNETADLIDEQANALDATLKRHTETASAERMLARKIRAWAEGEAAS